MVFADLFCGTTVVAQHFKRLGFRIISNDYLAFSHTLQMALIRNNRTPPFRKLKIGGYLGILDYLNSLKPAKGFFYEHYSKSPKHNGDYQRNYFSTENAGKIDTILHTLKYWKGNKLITPIEDYVLRSSLIDAATRVSNTSGTYGAFLDVDDPRMYKKLKLEPLTFIYSKEKHSCFNDDILALIGKVAGDILYLDPPYNQRQYPPYYHILETISLDDEPKIYGRTGRRPYREKRSSFCIKKFAKNALMLLIQKAQFHHIFLSYNSEGLLSGQTIETVLANFGEVKTFSYDYRRYRSNNNGKKHNGVKEILFYVCKKNTK